MYEHFDASLHTLRIADFMVEPKVWVGTAVSPYNGGYESGNWGAFSRKKLELICERFNLTYNDFMSTETMPSALQITGFGRGWAFDVVQRLSLVIESRCTLGTGRRLLRLNRNNYEKISIYYCIRIRVDGML